MIRKNKIKEGGYKRKIEKQIHDIIRLSFILLFYFIDMSKKTFWSESFRDSLTNAKEALFMKSKENFQNKKEDEKEDKEDEKLILEKEMTKRLKEEYQKKQKRMEMENYKHIELMENIDDEDDKMEEDDKNMKKSNLNVESIKKLVKSFSTLNEKIKKLNKFKNKKEEEEKKENEKEEEKKKKKKENEKEEETKEEKKEEEKEEETKEEGKEEEKEEEEKKEENTKESFNTKENYSNINSSTITDSLRVFFKAAQKAFNSLGSDIDKINSYVPDAICSILSLGEKLNNQDKQVIKTTWLHLVSFFITIYVFINWFYVIYFEKLANDFVDPDVFYPYLKFFKNIPGHSLLAFFLEVPLKVLDTMKDFCLYFLKTLPLEWGIGLEILIPLFLYLIYTSTTNINPNIIEYVNDLINGERISGTYTGIALILTLAFIIVKIPWVFTTSAIFDGPIISAIYTLVWFIIKFLVCIPITTFCLILYYVYYSFFVILFQPIRDLGFLGTLNEIHEKFVNFNPLYSEVLQNANCVSSSDSCKEQTFFGFFINLIIIPSLVFVIRHFLSFIIVLFLVFSVLTAYHSINSFSLKMNLVSIFGVIIFGIILLCKWMNPMTIGFPISPDINENKQINMGYAPFLGGINIMIIIMYFLFSNLLNSIPILHTITIFMLFAFIVIQFIYVISMNSNMDLSGIQFILSVLLAFTIMSYFGYSYFWNTTLGKLFMALVFIICILSIF